MTYSLALLTTRAECDAVLAYANAKLKVLTYRDTTTDYRAEGLGESAQNLKDELQGLNSYITAITPAVAAMDPGKERSKLADELRQRTDRRDNLVSRQGAVGPEKLVEQELEQALLDPLIPIVQDCITQVTTHRATLNS